MVVECTLISRNATKVPRDSCMLYIPVSALSAVTQTGALHYLWMFTVYTCICFVLNVFQPFKVGSQMCRNLPVWIDQLPHESWYRPDKSTTIKNPSKGTITLRLTHRPFFGSYILWWQLQRFWYTWKWTLDVCGRCLATIGCFAMFCIVLPVRMANLWYCSKVVWNSGVFL